MSPKSHLKDGPIIVSSPATAFSVRNEIIFTRYPSREHILLIAVLWSMLLWIKLVPYKFDWPFSSSTDIGAFWYEMIWPEQNSSKMNKSHFEVWQLIDDIFYNPGHGSLYLQCLFSVLVVFPFLTRKPYLFRPRGTLLDADIKVNRYTHHSKALVFLSSFKQLPVQNMPRSIRWSPTKKSNKQLCM